MNYMFLYICTINLLFHQVKMLMFYNVQTTNLTMVDNNKNLMHSRQL